MCMSLAGNNFSNEYFSLHLGVSTVILSFFLIFADVWWRWQSQTAGPGLLSAKPFLSESIPASDSTSTPMQT